MDEITQTSCEVHVIADVEQFHTSSPRYSIVFAVCVDLGVLADCFLDAVVASLEQVLVNIACAVCSSLLGVELVR